MDKSTPTATPAGYARRTLRWTNDGLRDALEGGGPLLFDGGMGTQLQERGLDEAGAPEALNLAQPEAITAIHAAYVEAGADVITTNTFGANAHKLAAAGVDASVDEVFAAAIACARAAGARFVAADIGPTGALLEPLGTMPFDEAYDLFAQQAAAAQAHGADLVVVETMADLAEAKAAVLAVRENCDLPVAVTMTFGEDGRTFLGTTPEVAAATLSGLGVSLVGINCSLGPAEIAPLVERMAAIARVPVMAQANAGLPQIVDGRATYPVGPDDFATAVAPMLEAGVRVLGGCCGTTPAHIERLRAALDAAEPHERALVDRSTRPFEVASAQRLVRLAPGQVGVVGERINPTGKRLMKEALRSGNLDYALRQAIEQDRAGAQLLDVNAGLPEIDEPAMLERLVTEVGQVTTVPLQVDSSDAGAIERVVRPYAGKPCINSVNGRPEVLDAVVPIAAHYGCALVGLCIDEDGIPATAQGRLAVARKIVAATDAAGIPRADVAIDCLTMAVSTDTTAALELLDAIRLVKAELPGVRCVLGVSNVSFGLPARPLVNATFLSAALAAGLDLAIVDPTSEPLANAIAAWRVLSGEDDHARAFVDAFAQTKTDDKSPSVSVASQEQVSDEDALATCVLEGRAPSEDLMVRLMDARGTLGVIDDVLIPALDRVGQLFEKGTFFLPQLMASAEAAKAGFDSLRAHDASTGVGSKGTVVLATVEGDIHDIGKNIVRMLLENYDYRVIDLGRDVAPQAVVDAVVADHVQLCGLSALMTTTVPAMAATIELLREQAPWCRVCVGGAVLTPEYAQMVGADFYAKDANETARIAAQVFA